MSFRITVVYSTYYAIRKATCRERHILPRPTPQPERLFRNTEEPVSYCQRAFPTPRESPYETSEEALPQHRKHLSAIRKRVDRHTEWGSTASGAARGMCKNRKTLSGESRNRRSGMLKRKCRRSRDGIKGTVFEAGMPYVAPSVMHFMPHSIRPAQCSSFP